MSKSAGTPTTPTNPPTHKAQSTLLQRGLFPKELNAAYALKGERTKPANPTAGECLLANGILLSPIKDLYENLPYNAHACP